MSVLFTGASAGDLLDATVWTANFDLLENSFLDRGNYIVSGLLPSIGAGLAVSVTAGTASIGGRVLAPGSFNITGLSPSTTNYLYLLQNGTGTSNTTGTAPTNSVRLGTAATGVGTVTSVNVLRSSGRQLLVRPENQVAGDAGSMGSIDLSDWNATAADTYQVFGTLPTGALPAVAVKQSVSMSLLAGYTPTSTGADAYEGTVPRSAVDGTTSLTWAIRRITFRVSTAGGAPSLKVQKSTVGDAAFGTGTDIGTVTLASGGFEASITSSLGTVTSGDKLRVWALVLGTAVAWSVDVLMQEQ